MLPLLEFVVSVQRECSCCLSDRPNVFAMVFVSQSTSVTDSPGSVAFILPIAAASGFASTRFSRFQV